jgi:hypothetical protein
VLSNLGIVLSIESERIKAEQLKTPWKAEDSIRQKATTPSPREERSIIYIPEKLDRLLLYTFAHKGLVKDEFDAMLVYLRNTEQAIANLLDASCIKSDPVLVRCDSTLIPFFSSCSKSIFPAIHFIPRAIWPELDLFLETKTLPLTSIKLFTNNSPLLAGFFSFYHQQSTSQKESSVCNLY